MQQLEFRLTERQRKSYLVAAGILVCVSVLRLFTGDVPGGMTSLVTAAIVAAMYLISARFGLTLTPQGVTMHGYQKRVYAWNQIQSVEPTLFWFQRRTLFKFTDGTSRRSWAPMHYFSMPDPEFQVKVQGIQQWHAQFTGPQQQFAQPPYAQPVPPQQPYAQPQQAPYPAPNQQVPYAAPGQQAPYPAAAQQAPYAAPGQQAPHAAPGPQQPYGQPAQPPAPQQTPGEWTQVFGAGGTEPPQR